MWLETQLLSKNLGLSLCSVIFLYNTYLWLETNLRTIKDGGGTNSSNLQKQRTIISKPETMGVCRAKAIDGQVSKQVLKFKQWASELEYRDSVTKNEP